MISKYILSFDAETNGLWGQAFSIGAVVFDSKSGKELAHFVARCPIQEEINQWVAENVIPQMREIPETAKNYEELLQQFGEFYLANKDSADIIVHMGVPVESKVLQDLHSFGIIGDWDGPFPLIDIAGNLQQAGFDPTSVDNFNRDHGIIVPLEEGGTHNPLYDSRAAALCYMELMK